MKKSIWVALVTIIILPAVGQRRNPDRTPIIDMHLHSDWWGVPYVEDTISRLKSYKDQASLRDSTLFYLRKYNIVKAVTDGRYALEYWEKQPEIIIPAIGSGRAGAMALPFDTVRKRLEKGTFKVLAEFTSQYAGLPPTHESLDKYFALAEELDIPFGIHMGLGPPGAAYSGSPKYRMNLSNPLLLEEVLLKHPRLRIYIMHAGWPFVDELIGLLWAHPQVYVDIGVIDWILTRKEFHNYLKRIIEAGYGHRVMFGSDEMQWPQAIKIAIENVKTADFLTEKQKEDIFYNNAAKFLRLPDQEIKKHKGR